MKQYLNIFLFGFIIWLIPFVTGFFFYNRQGELMIGEPFFKTIMLLIGSGVGVLLTVRYFRLVKSNFLFSGVLIGLSWLAINWFLDLILVQTGFFGMTILEYFTDIGLRYVCLPMYTAGVGLIMQRKFGEKITQS